MPGCLAAGQVSEASNPGDGQDRQQPRRPYRYPGDAEPCRHDDEAAGRQKLEEIDIKPLSSQQTLRAVQQNAFVAQPKDRVHERQTEHEDSRADE